mgnify:CR=1 FL=1
MTDDELRAAAPVLDARLNDCTFRTFVHGDAKVANFCFSDDGRVAAVDFQYVGGGCGMKDVAYFIGSCLDESECERREASLLDAYFSALKEALALQPLLELKKPFIVAFNKLDRYTPEDQALIRRHLTERFATDPRVTVVGIATSPARRVIRIGPDGSECEEVQTLPPQIDELRAAVQSVLDSNMALLEHLRDTAVFRLTAQKLEQLLKDEG